MPNKFSWKSKDEDPEDQERAFGTFDDEGGEQDMSIGSSSDGSKTVPSNASTFSGQTASTAQSSLFSRNAPTTSTVSTVESRASKLANILEQSEDYQVQQSGALTAGSSASTKSQQTGRKMKVIDFENLSEIDTLVSSDVPQQPQQNASSASSIRPTSSQNRSFMAALDPYIYNSSRASHSDTSSSASTPTGANRQPQSPQLLPQNQRQYPLTPNGELQRLADDLTTVLNQTNRILELSRAAVHVNHMLKNTAQAHMLSAIEPDQITLHSEPAISRILKIVLHFVDNLLRSSQYHSIRMLILQSLYDLGTKLQLVQETPHSVPYPNNFAIGSIPELPGQELMCSILDQMVSKECRIAEQEGAFIAPILRGISEQFSVLCLSFGFPDPDFEHYEMVSNLHDIAPDVHIYCQKNFIRACATSASSGKAKRHASRLKPPFRTLNDTDAPPIAVSISASSAVYQSGTLGGYVYPKVKEGHPLYQAYGKSTFAMTCGHVVLMDSGSSYPEVSVPSSVLISYYRKTLSKELDKYPQRSEERATYQREINELDKSYPVSGPQQTNRPPKPFGQIAWGERKVVNGAMSDLAIIKCAPELKCRNYLGDDVEFSEYDPALMFGNLHVKRIVRKVTPGLKVFKYGSTSKYTSGRINGPKIVYWADGRLQTSEFVVASQEATLFASGGDSGSWVLQKSEDGTTSDDDTSTVTSGSSNGPSLGVVGMLHSYDGEKREFGLITSIDTILDRLYQVTNVQWGVVGVPDEEYDTDFFSPAGGSDSSSSDNASTDED